jgi:hypothetical protein
MSTPAPQTCEKQLTCEQYARDGWHRPMPAYLRYTQVDPYAVAMVFPPAYDRTREVTWLIDFSMLDAACAEPQGEGDVRLTPSPDGAWLKVELGRGPERTVLGFRVREVLEFLEEGYLLIPGAEELARALQAGLDQLPKAGQ